MTKLTDTQRVILSAASQRTDRLGLPLPRSLKGGAAHKVVNALIEKGLLKEVKANRKLGDPVWRVHALVWQKPLKKLAIEFGISATELSMICRQNSILCPPSGHWTIVALG